MTVEGRSKKNQGPRIWAVGGGKGGIGKSVLSILLAVHLAKRGLRTVLVDADLGGANLHTLMGLKTPARSLNDFLNRKYASLGQVCLATEVPHLQVVCGASEVLTMANLAWAQKTKILQAIEALAADHVVLDLGAGASFNVLDFFLAAHHPVVVVTAQPAAIQNAYAFVRNALYRRLSRLAARRASLQELIRNAMDPKNDQQVRTVRELLQQVEIHYGKQEAQHLAEEVGRLHPLLVTNMVKEPVERKAAHIIQLVAEKYLAIQPQDLGAVPADERIAAAVARLVPLQQAAEGSAAAAAVDQMISAWSQGAFWAEAN